MILPADVKLCSLEPRCVGKTTGVAPNASTGNSQTTSEVGTELEELRASVKWGADTVMGPSSEGYTPWGPTSTAPALPSRIIALPPVLRAWVSAGLASYATLSCARSSQYAIASCLSPIFV